MPGLGTIILAVVIIIIIIILLSCICIVPQASAWVIESLGKYRDTWHAGLHLKVPILYRVTKKVSLKEQVADFEPQPVITKDNVTMRVDSVVFFYIFDPKAFAYGVERPVAAIENLSATTLRNIIGSMTLDETLTSRDDINGRITAILDEATDKWGIKVSRVEVKNIEPPKSIQDAMEKQMKAEREREKPSLPPKVRSSPRSPLQKVKSRQPSSRPRPLRSSASVRPKVKPRLCLQYSRPRQRPSGSSTRRTRATDTSSSSPSRPQRSWLTATKLIVPSDIANLAGTIAALKESAK